MNIIFSNNPATTEIYTLSLHDALPISGAEVHSIVNGRWSWSAGAEVAHRNFRNLAAISSPVQPEFFANATDRKSTRLNSSHLGISYAVFCLKKKKKKNSMYVKQTTVGK